MIQIVIGKSEHLAALEEVERSAATLLVGEVPESVLAETTERAVLESAAGDGRLWVAQSGDRPVGFAFVVLLASGRPHLQEIDVLPDFGRQGIGAALLAAVQQWAAEQGHPALTLTTFRHLPWNMPFYARHGFSETASRDLSDELRAIVANETARGLAPERRVVMRYEIPHPPDRPVAK